MILLLAAARLPAATPAEDRAWISAQNSFNEARWPQAEMEFADFIKKYPNSGHYAEAVLSQAQTLFKQGKYDAMLGLLIGQQERAGLAADRFAFWSAEGYYYSRTNYPAAAAAYARLIRDYPNSEFRPQAMFSEAKARSELNDRSGVIELLGSPEMAFQQAARLNPSNEWVVLGLFLLTETELAQNDAPAAEKGLLQLPSQKLSDPELEWKRQYLFCRVKIAAGRAKEALQNGAQLLEASGINSKWRAESISLLGNTYRSLDRLPEAIATFGTNLSSDLPAEQREAMLNIVELSLRQGRTDEAAQKLEAFLSSHPNDKGSDFERLMLGELWLKQYFQASDTAQPVPGTNYLQQARTNFEWLVNYSTNRVFKGKAQLNLGWCLVATGNIAGSQAAFSNAVELLPFSEDQAVALFKLGDTLYVQQDFRGAVSNYSRIIDQYVSVKSVTNDLFEPAFYQMLRAGVEEKDFAVASNALRRMFDWFPEGPLGGPAMLLLGEAVSRGGNPAEARALFSRFKAVWSGSALEPEVELAMARTYEREDNWPEAIGQLERWAAANTNHAALPRAEFELAWANYKAGNETNALSSFESFVKEHPTNELAARARYWIGGYYFREKNYREAEKNYQEVTNWPVSTLTFRALMDAGRAAMGRQNSGVALSYFGQIAAYSNCPADLRLEAQYAEGDANFLLALSSPANVATNYLKEAAQLFDTLAALAPSNRLAPMAWGRLGDCYFQLGAQDASYYAQATNAYLKAMGSPLADVSIRSLAECGLAMTLEHIARSLPATDPGRRQLYDAGVQHYLNVVNGKNLLPDEKSDMSRVEYAGLNAGRMLEDDELGNWEQAYSLYKKLYDEDLPPLKTLLDGKIKNARKHLPSKDQ